MGRTSPWIEGSLKKQQSVFTRPAKKSEKVTEASFKATHFLIKKKKPFSNGKVVKEAMMIIANIVLKDKKNGTDIISTLSDVQLGASTMDRGVSTMSGNLADQLDRNLTGLLLWSANIQVSSLTVKLTQTKDDSHWENHKQHPLQSKTVQDLRCQLNMVTCCYRAIRWLSRGRVLHRFLSLLGEI